MSTLILLLALGPGPEFEVAGEPSNEDVRERPAAISVQDHQRPPARSPQALREAYADLVQRSQVRKRPDFSVVVPELVALYEEYESSPGLSHLERTKTRSALKVRLTEIRNRLIGETRRLERELARRRRREARRDETSASEAAAELAELERGLQEVLLGSMEQPAERTAERGKTASRAPLTGGGAAARALQLIDLIQTTIEPESWRVNGGRGTISYFPLLYALVIRQTGEVHHQIGGTLGQLR